MKGTVKWFNNKKAFGFIQPEDGSSDVFVHLTALKDAGIKFLNEGDEVSYELTTSNGKTSATDLKVLKAVPYEPKPRRS
ncbi:MAG: cold-shock protein [Rickettsiales bacterium]|jgi:CspA family cold shock protein|nr:cold-shock protein [Rickettsiales bacterium]